MSTLKNSENQEVRTRISHRENKGVPHDRLGYYAQESELFALLTSAVHDQDPRTWEEAMASDESSNYY